MGKKGGGKKGPNLNFGSNNSISLREETTGRKQTRGGSSNAKSVLKVKHLESLATWASGDASIPSLGALFGRRLASVQEALGVAPDSSLIPCQRCETILQPGFNCTVRIEKNRTKPPRRSKKPNNFTQNNVVYTCHFCSHRNLKRGTPKGYMKDICPPKIRKTTNSKPDKSISKQAVSLEKGISVKDEVNKNDEIALPAVYQEIPIADSPTPAVVRTGTSLLDSKRRKRNRSAAKKPPEPESCSTPLDAENSASKSNKRRRKTWTSLKEIAESSDHCNSRNITNLRIPFST
ncbi:hypothetical protein FNV43_RR09277 [Rhamnella rubrinervis]|uniref:Uncharacterized protein n=1 Tax=Rhamnella rubrinervis TaxID=2594499 RepID=A0A8K0MJM1_9ROSA|nr:hypothetical protein FNV43_RR09277 [Rhamnella rubrinervis]